MYRKIDDFLKDWEYESEATLKVFNNLTDESLDQRVNEEGRTLSRLAWHIIETLSEMPAKAGLPVEEKIETPEKLTAATIVEAYKKGADTVAEVVKSTWKDEELTEKVNMYGEEWAKGVVLSILIMHQTHHRGQMTVLMRQAGLKVPGVYGPSKEEWLAFGMPAMA